MSIKRRLISYYLAVILTVVTCLGVFFIWFLNYYYMETLKQNMFIQARITAEFVGKILEDGFPETEIQAISQRMGDDLGVRFTVIDIKGKVLGDSIENPAVMDNHLYRPEVQEALRNREGYESRYSDTYEENLFYVAVPVFPYDNSPEQEPLGVARLALPLTGIREAIFQLQKYIITALIISGLGAVFLGSYLSKKITDPLERISRDAEAIASGNYDGISDEDGTGRDEIARLNRTIRQTGRALKSQMDRIIMEKSRVETVIQAMNTGIILSDRRLKIEMINPEAERLLGINRQEAMGQSLQSILRTNVYHDNLKQVLGKKESCSFEISVFYPHAGILQVSLVPVTGEHNNVISVLSIFHDITALRSLEKMRSEFAANVSHELRTPLTSIRGYTETILSRKDLKQESLTEFLEIIGRETQRLSTLVDSLLDLSRIEEHKGIVKKQLTDIGALTGEVADDLDDAAHFKGISIVKELPPAPVYVQGNPDWLRQALYNILENAINYNHRGGKVLLKVFQDEQNITVEIRDEGPGIPPQDLPRVFERFYRVDKARSKKLGGTGLGLSIVKHILDAHEAVYTLESEEDKGTVFRFSLPLQKINN